MEQIEPEGFPTLPVLLMAPSPSQPPVPFDPNPSLSWLKTTSTLLLTLRTKIILLKCDAWPTDLPAAQPRSHQGPATPTCKLRTSITVTPAAAAPCPLAPLTRPGQYSVSCFLSPSEPPFLHGAQADLAGTCATSVSSALRAGLGLSGVERDVDEDPGTEELGSAFGWVLPLPGIRMK